MFISVFQSITNIQFQSLLCKIILLFPGRFYLGQLLFVYFCPMQKICFILFCFLSAVSTFSQSKYPQNYFRSPVDTSIILSGNFGEIRPNHFHAGFDIKTGNREGMPVYSVGEGFISRIKISPYGYGKALYIVHPNGYTSVYGHLKDFPEPLKSYIKNLQLKKRSFEIDTVISPLSLSVKKGELIGYSGNTGGSQGPHLHFEIRETDTEKPVNPYLFGYIVADTVKPRITRIAIYPMDENAIVNGKKEIRKIVPLFKKDSYQFKTADSIVVSGNIGFALECYDTETGSKNQNSVYSIELQSGGKRIYYCEFEKFSFENSRYVNAHIDYSNYKKNKIRMQKCFLSENNKIDLYNGTINKGIIDFNDDAVHWVRFIVKDFAGNTTELMMKVQSRIKQTIESANTVKPSLSGVFFDCSISNKFTNKEIELAIPENSLYDDLIFEYSIAPKLSNSFSSVHRVQNSFTALQKAIGIKIKTSGLPDSLSDKACIVSVNDKGKFSYEGGKFVDGWLSTETKSFGDYTVTVDTTAPKIKLIGLEKRKSKTKETVNDTLDLSKAKQIAFRATDNLSGIKKYELFIDEKWVIMEYETKEDLLFYLFDENVGPGIHTLRINVSDDKGNKTSSSFIFKR